VERRGARCGEFGESRGLGGWLVRLRELRGKGTEDDLQRRSRAEFYSVDFDILLHLNGEGLGILKHREVFVSFLK